MNEYVWEAYQRTYGGGPLIARAVIEIYSEPAINARLATPEVDVNYYRLFEKTHQELLGELMNLKKLEREEQKGPALQEAQKKVQSLVDKARQHKLEQQKPPEASKEPTIALTLLPIFRK